jgi:collagenase-like PrtC family protease
LEARKPSGLHKPNTENRTPESKVVMILNQSQTDKIRIHAPAGDLKSLKAGVEAGADVVYFGFDTASNLRNFKGLNFSYAQAEQAIAFAHDKGVRVHITVNNYPQSSELGDCRKAVDQAHRLGADAVIISDLGILSYARSRYPALPINISCQAGVSNLESLDFYMREFEIKHFILPRVLTLDEISRITSSTSATIEIFALGSLCINYEGKCYLSPYITGESTNTAGTCSTPKYLSFEDNGTLTFKMNGVTLNRYEPEELAAYPKIHEGKYRQADAERQWIDHFLINRRQICKGRYQNADLQKLDYSLNCVVYLNTLHILPEIIEAGVGALKIEGRQRSYAYVGETVRAIKKITDSYYADPSTFKLQNEDSCRLQNQFRGLEPCTTCYLGK